MEKIDEDNFVDKESGSIDHTHPTSRVSGELAVDAVTITTPLLPAGTQSE